MQNHYFSSPVSTPTSQSPPPTEFDSLLYASNPPSFNSNPTNPTNPSIADYPTKNSINFFSVLAAAIFIIIILYFWNKDGPMKKDTSSPPSSPASPGSGLGGGSGGKGRLGAGLGGGSLLVAPSRRSPPSSSGSSSSSSSLYRSQSGAGGDTDDSGYIIPPRGGGGDGGSVNTKEYFYICFLYSSSQIPIEYNNKDLKVKLELKPFSLFQYLSKGEPIRQQILFEHLPQSQNNQIDGMNVLEKNIKSTNKKIESYNFHPVNKQTFENFKQKREVKIIGTLKAEKMKRRIFDPEYDKGPFFDLSAIEKLKENGIDINHISTN